MGIFNTHNHSYGHNTCSFNNNIHNCMDKYTSINTQNITYIIMRHPIERLLSYYLSNYGYTYHSKNIYRNLSFEEFLYHVFSNKINDDHITPFYTHLENLKCLKNHKIVLLKDLDIFMEHIIIKYGLNKLSTSKPIINKSSKHNIGIEKPSHNDYFNEFFRKKNMI